MISAEVVLGKIRAINVGGEKKTNEGRPDRQVLRLREKDAIAVGVVLGKLGYQVDIRRSSVLEVLRDLLTERGEYFYASRKWREQMNSL